MDGRGMGHGRPTEQRNKKFIGPQLGIFKKSQPELSGAIKDWIPGENRITNKSAA